MLSYGLNRLGREFIINLRPYMVRNLRLRQDPPFFPYSGKPPKVILQIADILGFDKSSRLEIT